MRALAARVRDIIVGPRPTPTLDNVADRRLPRLALDQLDAGGSSDTPTMPRHDQFEVLLDDRDVAEQISGGNTNAHPEQAPATL